MRAITLFIAGLLASAAATAAPITALVGGRLIDGQGATVGQQRDPGGW